MLCRLRPSKKMCVYTLLYTLKFETNKMFSPDFIYHYIKFSFYLALYILKPPSSYLVIKHTVFLFGHIMFHVYLTNLINALGLKKNCWFPVNPALFFGPDPKLFFCGKKPQQTF